MGSGAIFFVAREGVAMQKTYTEVLRELGEDQAREIKEQAERGYLKDKQVNAIMGKLWDDQARKYAELIEGSEKSFVYPVMKKHYDDRIAEDQEVRAGTNQAVRPGTDQGTAAAVENPEQAEQKVLKLVTVSADKLVNMELPPTRWIVEGLIAEDQVVILGAPRKIGKSWFCLQMCLAISEGKPFLGYQTTKGRVLYCDLESTLTRPQARLKKLLGGRPAPDTLEITAYMSKSKVLRISEGFERQIRLAKEDKPDLKLVVVDVFQTILPPSPKGVDKYELAYAVIRDSLKALADDIHVSFLLVTHTRKGTAYSSGDPFEEIIGSTGIQGAVDTMLVILKDHKSEDKKTCLHVSGKDIVSDDLIISFNDCVWTSQGDKETWEMNQRAKEYRDSPIRHTLIELVEQGGGIWAGTVSDLISESHGKATITRDVRQVGTWLKQNEGYLWSEDSIELGEKKSGSKRLTIAKKKEKC